MKKIRLLTTILIVLIGTMTLSAQTDENKTLTLQQWKRGIAIVGQNAALDGRYGHPESEFPKDYSLDDLNQVYKSSKWKKVYTALKAKEGKVGSIADLREIAKEYTPPYGVVRKLNDYIASHPEQSAAPEPKPAADTVKAMAAALPDTEKIEVVEAVTVDENLPETDSVAVIETTADNGSATSGSGWSVFFDVILLIIAAAALYLAWTLKKENAELKKELDYKVDKLNSQFEKFSKNITTDLNRVTYLVNKRRPVDIEFLSAKDDDEKPEYRGPRKLYLTKPDANDYFIRSTEAVEVGNSVFELTTNDGVTGTFKVIDNYDVQQTALQMPTEYLLRACTGKSINISSGKTRIITDREGTARCENGRWHVAVQAIIHYEA